MHGKDLMIIYKKTGYNHEVYFAANVSISLSGSAHYYNT